MEQKKWMALPGNKEALLAGYWAKGKHSVQLSSVTELCRAICDPMDCSTPGFPVYHQLTGLAQIHVHWVGDPIQPSHPLVIPISSCLQSFPASGSFPVSQFFPSSGESIGVSASASVLPIDFLEDGLVGTPCCPRNSQESSPTPQCINFSVLSFLYSPTLTSVHDYWKNHSFD